jgi:hypothetical protein
MSDRIVAHPKTRHFSLLLLYCCAPFSFAQAPIPAPVVPISIFAPQPLPLMTQYLSLTDSQLQTISQNNDAFNQFSSTKQARIYQVQTEIAQVTQASPIDPMGLGVRYAEIEEICRELRTNAAQSQQQNRTVLTDAQKLKLQALQDAMNLMPLISEGQSDNLLPANSARTASLSGSFADFLLGTPVNNGRPGCTTPPRRAILVGVPAPPPLRP